jgi:hypothetical protein
MTALSSYKPFLIGEGQEKIGLFTYLPSWQKPQGAYDTLLNAYIYKGVIYQRAGMQPYQSAAGNGGLVYIDDIQIGLTNSMKTSYGPANTGYVAFPKLPIIAGTVVIRTNTSAGVEVWTDDGLGILTGDLGDTGTVNYVTGGWSILMLGGRTIPNATTIYGDWSYVPTQITTGSKAYNPIMGIKQFINPANGQSITVVMDTRRASYYNESTKSFVGLNQFTQVIGQQFATSTTFGPVNTQFTNLAPYSVIVTDNDSPVNSMVDNGAGSFIVTSGAKLNGPASSVNYSTGVITVVYSSAPTLGVQITVVSNLSGDYFTGNNTNFFNATNWTYNDVEGSFLFFTNNVDPITLFNGTQLSRPMFNTTLATVQSFAYTTQSTITTCLDIKVYKNRLCLIRTQIYNSSGPNYLENQTVRFSIQQQTVFVKSVIFSAYNFAADVPGNGGFTNCPTGDLLQASQLIRDVLIIFATNSTWLFRFTASVNEPYRFDQVNSTRSTSAPYGTIPHDQHATSMGIKGLISCDGVNVDRYDQTILDQFEQINQSGFGQCFGQKYDTLNQAWMLYPSQANKLLTNDSALIWNYLENTWAVFTPNLGNLIVTPTNINALSCLGLGLNVEDITWADFAANSGSEVEGLSWSEANFPWVGYLTQTLSSVLLGGDQNGVVYQMNVGVEDNGRPVKTSIVSKRYNPFAPDGLKARFGYLDVYYEVNPNITLTYNFYMNNSEDVSASTTLTLSGPQGSIWAWKRLYLNYVGEFLQFEITNETPPLSQEYNTGGSFTILGHIIHAYPAGRLTPGLFI